MLLLTPEEMDINELLAYYDNKEKEEVDDRVTMEAHEVWMAEKLKAAKAVEAMEAVKKKAEDRAKSCFF